MTNIVRTIQLIHSSYSMDLSKLSRADLRKLSTDITKEMKKREERERTETRKKLTAMAADAGFSVEELFGASAGKKRAKAKIKYRDPKNADNTWSGRGRMPLWMAAEVKKGKKKDDFAV